MNGKQSTSLRDRIHQLGAGLLALPVLGPLSTMMMGSVHYQPESPSTSEIVQHFISEQSANLRSLGISSQDKLQALRETLAEGLEDLRSHPSQVDLKYYGKQFKRALKYNRAEAERQQQIREFWIAMGFGLGLTAAAIITIQFIRRRQLQQLAEVESEHIQIALQEEELNGPTRNVSPRTNIATPIQATESKQESEIASIKRAAKTRSAPSTAPADANYVGLISRKLYYPIETPLNNVANVDKEATNIIYFTTEEEAIARGYTPA